MSEFINTIETLGDEAVITSIIDRTITEFNDDAIVKLGIGSFQNCTRLQSVKLPLVSEMGKNCFRNCTQLQSVELPSVTDVKEEVFYGCNIIQSIRLPEALTIDNASFANCTALQKVDLPKATNLVAYAFSNCKNLQTVILRSTTLCTLANSNVFASSGISAKTGYIYVPSSLIESYKTAVNWSTYASQFRSIEDYPDITG